MTPSEQSVTHPAKLPASLQRNLSLYAIAATAAGVQALALAQPSEAEVVYTPAHTFIGSNRHFSFDLNNDGVNDFTILNFYGRASAYTGCRLEVRPDGGGGIEYNNASHYFRAAVFQKGQTIGFSHHLARSGALMEAKLLLYGTGHFTYGYWENVKNGYLGLAFRINGQIHFGWARLDVKTTGYHIHTLLTGYAYETQPDTPIVAGDTGGIAEWDKEGQIEAQTEPATETAKPREVRPGASLGMFSLGALSLGAPGLALWRRPDF